METYENFIPIPNDFWSFETGKPFEKCSSCNRNLFKPGTNYFIEKAIHGAETVFEYAMCLDCYENLYNELSIRSRKLIENYFDEHIDIEKRNRNFIQTYGMRCDQWLSKCMIKNRPREDCKEYQLYGFCIDKDLVFNGMPYILCSDVIEDLLELLSHETLGTLNEFSGCIFDIDLPQNVLMV